MLQLPSSAVELIESGANAHLATRVVEVGAPELLASLASRFLGPGVDFPPDGARDGWVLRITPTRIGGSGPWMTA